MGAVKISVYPQPRIEIDLGQGLTLTIKLWNAMVIAAIVGLVVSLVV